MRQALLVVFLALGVSPASARPSNYFYRVSPAGAPLKEEPALCAKTPEYPAQAHRQHLTGSGVFAIHIRSDGTVARVDALKSIGHPILDQAAIAAFRQWRFRPHSISLVRAPIRYVIGPSPHDAISRHTPKEYGDGVQIDVSSPP
jgi:TonB family protein